MPKDPEISATIPNIERQKLADKIGDAAHQLTEAQAAQANKPAMDALLEGWRNEGKLGDPVFIKELQAILDRSAALEQSEVKPAKANVDPKTKRRLKIAGVALAGAAIAFPVGGALANGVGNMLNSETQYTLANVDGHLVEQGATEAEMIEFFNLTPSTHEHPDTKPFSFRPKNEVFYNFDGSEQALQAVLDDFSNMFRRDVRIQAAWASVLMVGDAPRVPSMTEMENPQVYADYHKRLYEYTDKLARDVKLRTTDYNEAMDILKRAEYGTSQIADQTHASEQHDGNRVTVRMNMDNDSQYLPFKSTNAKKEEVVSGVKGGCGQPIWITVSTATLPPVEVIDQPIAPPAPPVVTTTEFTPPPPTSIPPVTPPTRETPPPPTTTVPPPNPGKNESQNPMRESSPLPPVVKNDPGEWMPSGPVQHEAPAPPPPVYVPPVEAPPPITINIPAPDVVRPPSSPDSVWQGGNVPSHSELNPSSSGGSSGSSGNSSPGINSGMVGE